MKESDWYSLYSGGWRKEVTDASFTHPAKYARLLIRRIYDHAQEQGYIKPGDMVLDPFGGVGLGAVDALRCGIHWRGVELEQPFVDLGAGCDCTGISPSDWARFYGRWKQARYLDGRHWCPRCIGGAGVILDEPPTPPVGQAQAVRRARIAELAAEQHGLRIPKYDPLPLPDGGYTPRAKQLSIFGVVDSPSYERNSGRIPCASPHHYTGNLELFARRYARGGATAVLVQGDSRELGKVLGEAGGVVSSPPFRGSLSNKPSKQILAGSGGRMGASCKSDDTYGNTDGQLGNLPATDSQFQAVVGSPPYTGQTVHGGGGIDADRIKRTGGRNSQASAMDGYGDADGQLGEMPEGSHADAVIGSPPYAGSNPEANSEGIDLAKQYETYRASGGGASFEAFKHSQERHSQGYGSGPANLANLPRGSHAAVIGSPPYAESLSSDDPDRRGGLFRDPKRRNDRSMTGEYGKSRGQLGAMKAISSPPYEASLDRGTVDKAARVKLARQLGISDVSYVSPIDMENIGQRNQEYGHADGNVGNTTGEDFWTAARQIMQQVAQVLQPGSVVIWVLGGFVRDWQYVDFPDQWRQLGEACGFKTEEWIRAWKVESQGAQYTLDGGLEERIVQWKSFFRITNEKRGSPPVDFEVVLVQRKL